MLDFSVKAQCLKNTRPSATVEDALVRLAEKSMTDVQKRVLIHIYSFHRRGSAEGKTYSWHVREIVKTLGMPESTAKWSLNHLRDSLMLECGSMLDKGTPLRITRPGALVAERINARGVIAEIGELA